MLPGNGLNKNNLTSVSTLDFENFGIQNNENNVDIFKIGLLNIRSVKKKDQAILQYIKEEKIDVFVLTETWLRDDDDAWSLGSYLNRDGFHLSCADRDDWLAKRGEGLGIIVKDTVKCCDLDNGIKSPLNF